MLLMTLRGKLLGPPLENRLLRGGIAFVLSFSTMGFGCQSGANANHPVSSAPANAGTSSKPGYQIVKVYPHDPDAYTQGLVFANGNLLESTGREGHSSLRLVELQTGRILNQVNVPTPYFAEGLALLNGKLFQLTWQHGVGFIYDATTFDKLGEFKYSGEGWGLTTDGSSLILSDGTNRIRFLDPETFKQTKSITVVDRGRAIDSLNELEYVRGEIYANIWHDERVVRIESGTGKVNGWIDLTGLRASSGVSDDEGVLNGIAYDESNDRLFVTGKLWPKLFEIRLKQN
ncbi:MAG: glutaminyl-peptide cyclotransferase [Pyrinomonadaceae bacterium]